MCPRQGNDAANGHPRAHQPTIGERYLTAGLGWPFGRIWPTAKAVEFLCVDSTQRSETGQVRGFPCTAYGGKGQGKGKGSREGRLGQGGR